MTGLLRIRLFFLATIPIYATFAFDCNEILQKLYGTNKIFRSASYEGGHFNLVIQNDVVSGGLFQQAGETPKTMVFVENIPEKNGELPSLVSLVTDLGSVDGAVHIGWITAFDYKEILNRTQSLREQLRPGTKLIDAMKLNTFFGNKDEIHPQMKLLSSYLEQRVFPRKEIPDQLLVDYLTKQSKTSFRTRGVSLAVMEYLSRSFPTGTKVRFSIANIPTLEALKGGKKWDETSLGRMASRAGFKLNDIDLGSENTLPVAVLIKTGESQVHFNWDERP